MVMFCYRNFLASGFVLALACPAMAEDTDLDRLMDAMKFRETVEILHEEGLKYGGEVAAEMLPDANPDSWRRTVARVYSVDRMYALLAAEFKVALEGVEIQPLIDFYTSEGGQEIVNLEVAARHAFIDADIEAAAQVRYQQMVSEGAPILDQIECLIADSDLVEMNVAGALNSNLMFYRGLNDGGAFEISQDEMLSDVWAQEAEIRIQSEDWLDAFLLMAYQPLTPELLDDYSAFYRTPEGRDLNRALFAAYDKMYEQISYLLGQAVAQNMMSEKL